MMRVGGWRTEDTKVGEGGWGWVEKDKGLERWGWGSGGRRIQDRRNLCHLLNNTIFHLTNQAPDLPILHVHHCYKKASHIPIPILVVCRKFIPMDLANWHCCHKSPVAQWWRVWSSNPRSLGAIELFFFSEYVCVTHWTTSSFTVIYTLSLFFFWYLMVKNYFICW